MPTDLQPSSTKIFAYGSQSQLVVIGKCIGYVIMERETLTLDMREPESYEALSFSDIINEVEVLGKEGICIGGISYTVHIRTSMYTFVQ